MVPIWQLFAYLRYGLCMHHVITSIDEIQAGDVLQLLSNVGVTEELPNGRRQRIKTAGYVPTQTHTTRPDPDFVMEDPDRREKLEILVPTNTGSIRVIAITSFWIMVDFQHWYGRDGVQWANVIIFKRTFESLFLQQPQKYYCRLTGNVDGNPLEPPAGEEDEEDHNPPGRMTQANPYMIAMYG